MVRRVAEQNEDNEKGRCPYCTHKKEYKSTQAWYLHFKTQHLENYPTKAEQKIAKANGAKRFEDSMREHRHYMHPRPRNQEEEDVQNNPGLEPIQR